MDVIYKSLYAKTMPLCDMPRARDQSTKTKIWSPKLIVQTSLLHQKKRDENGLLEVLCGYLNSATWKKTD